MIRIAVSVRYDRLARHRFPALPRVQPAWSQHCPRDVIRRGEQRHGPLVPPADLRRDLVLALAGLVVLLICGVIAHTGRVTGPERFVFRAINELPGWLYPALWPLQQLGNLVAGFVVAVVALILRRWRLAIAALIVSVRRPRADHEASRGP